MRTILASVFLSILMCAPLQAQMPEATQASPAAIPPASEGKKLTLAQAEALALKNNPQITIGKLRALAARQYVREARSALLPNAYLSVTAVDSNPGSRLAAGALNNPILFPRAAAGASVGQLITDFGRSTNLLSSSESQAKAEDQNAAATTAQIVLAVDQSFYNVLETKALVVVAQQTVDSRQLFVDKIKALTDAKLKSDLDLSFAKVDLARGKLLLLEARNNYQASLAALSAILGYPEQQNFQLVEEQATISAPALDVSPLIQQALRQRPEVLTLQDQVLAAQKFGSAEHDLWRPTVSALGVVGEAPVRDDHIPNWYGAVGMNINIPVFNGFLFNARPRESRRPPDRRQSSEACRPPKQYRSRRAYFLAGHCPRLRAPFCRPAIARAGQPRPRSGAVPLQPGSALHRRIQPGRAPKNRGRHRRH